MSEQDREELEESIRKQFEPWTDVRGLSKHSGMSESWIYHHKHEIPHATAGVKLLFKLSEFDKYLLGNKIAAQESDDDAQTEDKNAETTIPPLKR